MTFKFSGTDQIIRVYNYSATNNEFIGDGDAFIPAGTGLPAYCTHVIPPSVGDKQVAAFSDRTDSWLLTDDYRECTVYRTDTGQAFLIENIGLVPEGTTFLPPSGPFDKWNGKKWIKDAAAEKAQTVTEAIATQRTLIREATQRIDSLNDALELGIATPEEKDLLTAWKKYRVLLNRIDTTADGEIECPKRPE